jgi:superfamily II DNA or RNA helicase
MRIPYVIDNQYHRLDKVLNFLLQEQPIGSMDVATAYFSIRGYQQIQQGLNGLANFRLLLGDEPTTGEDVGMRPARQRIQDLLRQELNQEPYSEDTLKLVEDLIRFLCRNHIRVRLYLGHDPSQDGSKRAFLHAKAYLLYAGADRLDPLVGVVGSSNFTGPGLTTNRELNTVHKTILELDEADDAEARAEVTYVANTKNPELPGDQRRLIKSEVGARALLDLRDWYDAQWEQSVDFKTELIDILNESKFGEQQYTPYQVYMKALYEYFKEDIGKEVREATRTAIELAEFQEDAVRRARRILAQYDGVMVADSVGLGKTWIGKRLLEDYAYHMRQKALVICPASLRPMWKSELRSATIAAEVLSQEEMGRADFEMHPYLDADVVLIDESHNFRNRNTNRYENLERVLSANGRRGKDGVRKKVILLTATPINNNVFDLYYQIGLITGGDRSYFAAAGIGDLYRYFLRARQAANDYDATVQLFNLLEEIVIRRTRPFIRRTYPEATIAGKEIKWPERQLRTIHYDLETSYQGIYAEIVRRIESLRLAHYHLEEYKRSEIEQDEFELGRQAALVGIFKSRLLKRFESSVHAFRISIRRALEFVKTFDTYLDDERLLDSASFHEVLRYLEREDEEEDYIPGSLADEMDAAEEAREILERLPVLDIQQYDLRRLRTALREDIDALTDVWYQIKDISADQDAKLQKIKEMLSGELRGRKVLIFSYYKDTARYLGEHLSEETFLKQAGISNLRRIDGGTPPADRVKVVEAFAPHANNREDIAGSENEIDVLVSTDVLSEGQNLQDAGVMLNYDLHWNPTRMIQRAGRIDRLGSLHDILWIYNMFPDQGLEELLGLVESLMTKIETINQAGFLDASVLGETVNPRNFNTLRRIQEEDNTVLEEQESFAELASSEALLRDLQQQLATEQLREEYEALPDGIHSGLLRERHKGVFFYFTAPADDGGRHHFWRYHDTSSDQIIDNRLLIANMIKCQQDTPRYVPEGEVNIFDVQERIIESIVQSSQERQAMEAAPKQVDPIQKILITLLQEQMNNPALARRDLLDLIKFLGQPMANVYVRDLRQAYEAYSAGRELGVLLERIREIQIAVGEIEVKSDESVPAVRREDLHLVCFDYVWS